MTRTLYGIRDTATGEMWSNRNGKTLWHRQGDAKNAWNLVQPYDYSRGKQARFDTEDHGLEIIEYTLVPTAELERLQVDAAWLEDLEAAGVDNWPGISFAHDLRREREGDDEDA